MAFIGMFIGIHRHPPNKHAHMCTLPHSVNRDQMAHYLCIAPPSGLSREVLRARAAAVAFVGLERVLGHVRRGKCVPLWDVMLNEVAGRLDHFQRLVLETLHRLVGVQTSWEGEGESWKGRVFSVCAD